MTAVLMDYRAFDTLIETAVIFTAGIGVLLTFASVQAGRKRDDEAGDEEGGE